MPDRLEALLANFSVSARAFQAGTLCGINPLQADGVHGQLHLIRSGEVEVRHASGRPLRIREPSLLLYPRPMTHRFVTSRDEGAEFVCAHLAFEGGTANPIAASLPPYVCLPLADMQGSEAALQLLFAEAAAQYCGRQAMLDRLFEVVLIQVLRQVMERGEARAGMLAGLGHQRLRFALIAMHEAPQREWTLDGLAKTAGMSRSVFANTFREVVGATPGAYLARWRIGLAQKALLQDKSIKLIAQDVGYGSEAALSRAFKAHAGKSPREWRNAQDRSR
jgi:AraC-like DNA-binding protein